MKPTRAQIRFLNECSTPIPETSEQASKLITAMLNNPTIPAPTTAPVQTAQDILKAELTRCACVLDYAMRFATSKGETQLASDCWHAAAQARLAISRASTL